MKLRSHALIPVLVISQGMVALPAAGDVPAGGPAFTPRVPISSLAMPATWFDPSRLRFSTSVSVGSGFGAGVNALQLTSLSYQFNAPLWMNVSVGNAWGPSNPAARSSFFLEGVQLAYRPHPSLLFQVQYRDFRSPLQYSRGSGYDFWSP